MMQDILDVALLVAQAIEEAGGEYFVGGSVASSLQGEQRATNDIDFVVIRENTEGVYMDMGGFFKKDTPDEVATQEDINTRKGVERVIYQ